jgi:hypothetical protein
MGDQAWGVMEAHNGNPKKARELFQQGSERCEPHAPLLNAWAHFEASMTATLTLFLPKFCPMMNSHVS